MSKRKNMLGLVTIVRYPQSGNQIMLHRIGRHYLHSANTETIEHMLFKGMCNVSVYGSARENESIQDALRRLTGTQLGTRFEGCMRQYPLGEILQEQDEEKNYRFFCRVISPSALEHMRLHRDTGGLEFIPQADVGYIKSDTAYRYGTPDWSIYMTPVQEKAVREALRSIQGTL